MSRASFPAPAAIPAPIGVPPGAPRPARVTTRRAFSAPAGVGGRSELERAQLRKLRHLLRSVLAPNPFYAAKLAHLGPRPVVKDLADFTNGFPATTKSELTRDQLSHPPYGSNLTFPLARYTRCHQTSGSTGAALRWLDTPESWQHLLGNWHRILSAAGVAPADRFLFAFSFGPFIGSWPGATTW